MVRILITLAAAFVLGLAIGKVLLPALRALKAGQSIREIGPKWHASKAGTPTMGGILFILAALVCVAAAWPAMRRGDYGHLSVFGFSLVFGVIGFLDDFVKVRYCLLYTSQHPHPAAAGSQQCLRKFDPSEQVSPDDDDDQKAHDGVQADEVGRQGGDSQFQWGQSSRSKYAHYIRL